jgi:hypothetical protein
LYRNRTPTGGKRNKLQKQAHHAAACLLKDSLHRAEKKAASNALQLKEEPTRFRENWLIRIPWPAPPARSMLQAAG